MIDFVPQREVSKKMTRTMRAMTMKTTDKYIKNLLTTTTYTAGVKSERSS